MKLNVKRYQHSEPGKLPFELRVKLTLTENDKILIARYPLTPERSQKIGPIPSSEKWQHFYAADVYDIQQIEERFVENCQAYAEYLQASQDYGGDQEYSESDEHEFYTNPEDEALEL